MEVSGDRQTSLQAKDWNEIDDSELNEGNIAHLLGINSVNDRLNVENSNRNTSVYDKEKLAVEVEGRTLHFVFSHRIKYLEQLNHSDVSVGLPVIPLNKVLLPIFVGCDDESPSKESDIKNIGLCEAELNVNVPDVIEIN